MTSSSVPRADSLPSPEMAPFQVVHVTSERGWRGGERQLLLLMRLLRERHVRQVLAAPEGSPCCERARRAGFTVVPLHPRMPMHPLNLVRLLRSRTLSPTTILHAHTSPALSLAGAASKLGRVAGIVFTRRTAFAVRSSRKYRTAADIYVAVSSAAENRLAAAGTPAARLRLIPDGVDVDNLRETDSGWVEDGVPGPLVVTVGHLSREKGHRFLIDAWKDVTAEVPGARLIIAGEGPERDTLADQARKLGLQPSVTFAGFVEPVGGLLRSADLFVLPSLEEGLGSAALEAMWAGLPVVASAAGGISEAVAHGRTGLLVPPGDAGALAAAIVRLLNEPHTRLRMGAAGRARVKRQFHASTMAERYLLIYRSLLSTHSPRAERSVS